MSRTGNGSRGELGTFIVDRRGAILGFDHGMETLTGWPAAEMVGRGAAARGEIYRGEIEADAKHRSVTIELACRDGRRLETTAVSERLAVPGGHARVTIVAVLAMSAAEPAGPRLERRDALTRLGDADAFRDALERDLAELRGAGRTLALILADVDRLQPVNERLSRAAGDDVVRKLANILRVATEDESRTFRLEDDGFAIVLPGAGRGQARQQAASLRTIVERYRFFPAEPGSPRVTLSLGAASFPADAERPQDLVTRAAAALDEARALGGNRVCCYVRQPRVRLEVPVFFDGEEALLVGFTRDLSPSGIFVHTAAPIDIGMRCALTFPLPGHDERVRVIGRVVRAVPVEEAARATRSPGMGVEFESFEGASDRSAIETFLRSE